MLLTSFIPEGFAPDGPTPLIAAQEDDTFFNEAQISAAELDTRVDAVEEHRRGLEATIRAQQAVVADLKRREEQVLLAAEREDSQAKRALAQVTIEREAEEKTLRLLEGILHKLHEEIAALSLFRRI